MEPASLIALLLAGTLEGSAPAPAESPADSAAIISAIGPIAIQAPLSSPRYHPLFSEGEIGDLLKPFLGTPCAPAAIAEDLARRYRFLGYTPELDVRCDTGRLDVSIRESGSRIVLITFDADDLSRIGVSPDSDFQEKRPLYPVPYGTIRAVLRGLLQTREGDLYNHERYRSDSEALGRLGYAVAFVHGAAAGPEGYLQGAYLVRSLTRQRMDQGGAPSSGTSYLGGTASYGPRSGTAAGLLFQETNLFANLDSLTVAPTYNTALGGAITYTTPLLAARESPRRLYDLGGSLFSYFTHNRLIDGHETDERRTGGSLSLGFRPLGFGAPHDLRWQIGFRHERVDLGPATATVNAETLTFVQLGATYEWRHVYRAPSLTLRVAPAVDFSVEAAGGQESFVRPGVDATLHGRYLSGLETDFHLLGGTIDRSVPPIEQWSLGGQGTVRGFQEDAFLGRNILALQSELWVPFFRTLSARPVKPGEPLPEPGELPLEHRTARLLKAALFVDTGHLTGTDDGRNESILGAGVGVRFVVPRHPLVLRFDYGWGFGGQGGDSFSYLSAAYRF